MPIPVALAGGTLASGLILVLRYVMLAYAATWVTKILILLGLGFVTYELIIGPVIDSAVNAWQGIPPELKAWLGALGVDRVVSIILGAYLLLLGKQVLLTRRA